MCVCVCKCPHPCFKFAWLILNFSCIFSLHHVSSHEACTTQRHISTHTNNQGTKTHDHILNVANVNLDWCYGCVNCAQVVKKIKINVDTNISLGRGDERWVQQERVAPTLLNIQWTTPEDQMTSFSQHTRWSRHEHVLSMSTSHTWIPNCYTISILLACCPKSHTHTQSAHTLLAGCVGHICAPAHGKDDGSNYFSDFILHTCTQWSTSNSVLTGKRLFNLAALPRWTDTHTYARIKDMTQQYTGVDVWACTF